MSSRLVPGCTVRPCYKNKIRDRQVGRQAGGQTDRACEIEREHVRERGGGPVTNLEKNTPTSRTNMVNSLGRQES